MSRESHLEAMVRELRRANEELFFQWKAAIVLAAVFALVLTLHLVFAH